MSGQRQPVSDPHDRPASERLDSWKEIASYLRRDVRTVQRWERTEGLPVKRHRHKAQPTVYAFRPDIDTWIKERRNPSEPTAPVPLSVTTRRGLAVLPFENLSGVEEQEYFSDGLTEEMVVQLGRLRPDKLGVIGRTTMMQYKNTQKSIGEIGRELGVDYLLEGSVRRSDHRVRITAQLIQVSDQTHLWADSYERPLEDILSIQIGVAKRIARSLAMELLPEQHAELTRTSTSDAGAHDSYLRGLYLWNTRSERGFLKAIEYFQRAVSRDPEYAEAHVGLAICYVTLGWYAALPTVEAYRRATSAATRAIALDDKLAEGHTALGYAKHLYEWNWEVIEAEHRRALELNPSHVTAHQWYALFLVAMQRFDEALGQMKRALDLDPLSLVINAHMGWILYFVRENDKAIQQLERTVEIEPNFEVSRYFLGLAYEQKGMHAEAVETLKMAYDLSGQHPGALAGLINACGRAKRDAEARAYLKELKKMQERRFVSPYFFALAYAGCDQKNLAFKWFEKALDDRSGWLANLNVEPALDPIRLDPRFQDLVRRVGLPSGPTQTQ
jgi:TolB-like protein/Tfp pilus assembly protein PilF